MKQLSSFLELVGLVDAAFIVIGLVTLVVLWVKGIGPVIWRLGLGLAKRRVAIFAGSEMSASIRELLLDSRLFGRTNLVAITTPADLGKCESASIFIVYWPDFKDSLDEILAKKRDQYALLVYAPQDRGPLPLDAIAKLNLHRNFMLSNMRGRLLNDVIVSMITTSYEKRVD